MSEQTFIETSHGRIAVSDVNGNKTPLVMLHCNSGCKEMFLLQTQALTGTRRLVSLDLPGHGHRPMQSIPDALITSAVMQKRSLKCSQSLTSIRSPFSGVRSAGILHWI